ncbi:MAG: hypothetical protein H0X26_07970 [Alphaproteobacteria bacterium]|nr:hypothetical protein [Alphaproteobacteria bacterium]
MRNLLIKTIVILTIFHSGELFAGLEPYEEDVILAKRSFLISGIPFNERDKGNGAMTLCFKTLKDSSGFVTYEHAALLFEMFFTMTPNDVSVQMIHYGGEDGCCGGKNMHPWVDKDKITLPKVYRGLVKSKQTGEKVHRSATYVKYASWVLPNEALIKGYNFAYNDEKAHEDDKSLYDSYSCISYVQRIMQEVGLRNVEFGWWWARADNLKILVDKHITPRPHHKNYIEIGSPIIKPDEKVESKIIKSLEVRGSTYRYARRLLNTAIQNEKDLPEVAIQQYQELSDMGFFNEASEAPELKDRKKELSVSSIQ